MKYAKNLSKVYFNLQELTPTSYSLLGVQPVGTMVPISSRPFVINNFMAMDPVRQKDSIREYIAENAEILDSENFFMGSWFNSGSDLMLDVCQDVEDTQDAIFKAISRGLPKLFVTKGVKHVVEIDLPSPQRAGTNSQGNTYAKMKAMHIYENLINEYGQ